MGRFVVNTLPSAERDLGAIVEWIARDSPTEAARVGEAIIRAAESLARFPARAPLITRRFAGGRRVRCLLCLNHRILFTIDGPKVYILRILHGSRRIPLRLLSP